jgi:maltooligosyltrehalose synthase
MELEKLKKSTIIKLKKIKQEQNLSIKKIMDLLEDQGQFVSEGTLKKIFAEGSEEKSFRYQDTLAPLADVLLDICGDQSEVNDVATLKRIIREKNKQIEFLMVKMEEQKEVYAERKAMYERRIEDLNAQLKRLDISVEKKDKMLEQLMDKYLFKGDTSTTN